MVRIVKSPPGSDYTKESLSVIKTPQKTMFNIKQRAGLLSLKSGKLLVTVDAESGDVVFYSSSGSLLLKEKKDDARFIPFDDAGYKTHSVFQSFVLEKDESIYGPGQQQRGKMVQSLSRNIVLQKL